VSIELFRRRADECRRLAVDAGNESDKAAQEEEAWKFVLAKKDRKLVADFLRAFPNSKYVQQQNGDLALLGGMAALGAFFSFFFRSVRLLSGLAMFPIMCLPVSFGVALA
jgi:hypothetical protein